MFNTKVISGATLHVLTAESNGFIVEAEQSGSFELLINGGFDSTLMGVGIGTDSE